MSCFSEFEEKRKCLQRERERSSRFSFKFLSVIQLATVLNARHSFPSSGADLVASDIPSAPASLV